MNHWKLRRCTATLSIIVMFVASMTPFTAVAGAHDATRTDATFVITNGAPVDFGSFWQDANGGIHIRDMVTIDEVSGDISGTSTTPQNLDVNTMDGCESDECVLGVNSWGSLNIEDEVGSWEGRFVQAQSFVPDDFYDLGFVMLTGTGAYADMSFFGRITEVTEEDATIEGTIFTMATPVQSLNLSATLCAGEQSWSGGYLSSGVIEGSGTASGDFVSVDSEYASNGNLYGRVEIADEVGTATLEFVGGGQGVASADNFINHAFGTFIVTGGTGAYAELYGQGRIIGTATAMSGCASGFGAQVQFIGEAHMN